MWASIMFRSPFRFSTCSKALQKFRYQRICNRDYKTTLIFVRPQKYSSEVDSSRKRLYSDLKKEESMHIKAVKSREILQNVLEKRRDILIEKKNFLVKDIRAKKIRVKEKVREKVEEVIERENILTIPNFLTVGRGILGPYVGYVIIHSEFSLAMGLVIVAGLSDLLDGLIARQWPKQASKFGSFLDPLADKLLVGSLVISLGYCELLPVWLAGMVLFRDVFLVAAGFVIRYISLPPPVIRTTSLLNLYWQVPLFKKTVTRYFDATHVTAQLEPTFISKVNTAVQLLTITLSLGAPIWSYIDHPVLHGLWYLTGVTTAAAAISYLTNKQTYKILKGSMRKNT